MTETQTTTPENFEKFDENSTATSLKTIEILTDQTIQAENNKINFVYGSVSLPNFSISASDNSPISIAS
jgi:hypothetical protein